VYPRSLLNWRAAAITVRAKRRRHTGARRSGGLRDCRRRPRQDNSSQVTLDCRRAPRRLPLRLASILFRKQQCQLSAQLPIRGIIRANSIIIGRKRRVVSLSSIGAALSLARAPAPISSPSAPKAPRGDWGHHYRGGPGHSLGRAGRGSQAFACWAHVPRPFPASRQLIVVIAGQERDRHSIVEDRCNQVTIARAPWPIPMAPKGGADGRRRLPVRGCLHKRLR
jgi:hypothetical protein